MHRENRKAKFVKNPVFEGGMQAMRQLIRDNMVYPPAALENKIEGTVHLRYSIDRYGKVFNIKTVSGIGYGCDEEAVRLVGLFEFRMPKNRAGKLIFHKTLQIHFRLPNEPETNTQINYSYTAKKEDGGSYGYSIDF